MFYRWIFILGILLGGCSTFLKPNGLYNSPAETMAYSNAYLQYKLIYLNREGFDYPIELSFSHLEDNIAGVCHKYSGPYTRYVKLDYNYWQEATDDQRLVLMFHELAHCDLDMHHQDEVLGIMNSHLSITDLSNEQIKDLFLKEL